MNLTAIGAYIAHLRRQRSLTQRELASRLGVSCQAVSKWETGENLPDASILLPLADALHTTADALLSAGTHRLRKPVDLHALQGGVNALESALTTLGSDSPIGMAIVKGLGSIGLDMSAPARHEQLLTEAILHRLREGDTLSDSALVAVLHDGQQQERIRKCRHDCALFADKQQIYDDFRPAWPDTAVRFLLEHMPQKPVTADVGSGTGKLAVLLAPFCQRMIAVEPSIHMRQVLAARTAHLNQVEVLSATAESLPLPDASVDAITVAEAYHWFDNAQTRAEFRRILKPGGLVFLLWNRFRENPYDKPMQAIQQQYRTYPQPTPRTGAERADDLFGPGQWERFTFRNDMLQTFEQFFGGMSSASYAPEAGTVEGDRYRQDVRALFDAHSVHGRLLTRVETVCYLGRLNP